jgi:hypothetical protein
VRAKHVHPLHVYLSCPWYCPVAELERQGFLKREERFDRRDNKVRYNYYCVHFERQLRCIKYRLHRMRDAVDEKMASQQPSQTQAQLEDPPAYQCTNSSCNRTYTELDVSGHTLPCRLMAQP